MAWKSISMSKFTLETRVVVHRMARVGNPFSELGRRNSKNNCGEVELCLVLIGKLSGVCNGGPTLNPIMINPGLVGPS